MANAQGDYQIQFKPYQQLPVQFFHLQALPYLQLMSLPRQSSPSLWLPYSLLANPCVVFVNFKAFFDDYQSMVTTNLVHLNNKVRIK